MINFLYKSLDESIILKGDDELNQYIESIENKFPSANMVLIRGQNPILIDSGYGSDIKKTYLKINELKVEPGNINLLVNTHYHSDHVGGNAWFQGDFQIPIAAHTYDAQLINNKHHEACCSYWLDQPVEKYRVEKSLKDGDELNSGEVSLQVIHTPGHTAGHISLYSLEFQTLIVGDIFHQNDVGWINIFREGVSSISASLESLDKLSKLNIQRALSGHGPEIKDPKRSIDLARIRLEKWLDQPDKSAWHACKRIFAYSLMIRGGILESEIEPYLVECLWFQDMARHVFRINPKDFIQPFIREILRSKAADWSEGKLIAAHPHTKMDDYWNPENAWPDQW